MLYPSGSKRLSNNINPEVLGRGKGRSTTHLKFTLGHSLEILSEFLLENPRLG